MGASKWHRTFGKASNRDHKFFVCNQQDLGDSLAQTMSASSSLLPGGVIQPLSNKIKESGNMSDDIYSLACIIQPKVK